MAFYAHTPNEDGDWHFLEDHLREVANLAFSFAAEFGAEEMGRLAGLLHDIGKASDEFQDYLRRCHEAKLRGSSPPAKGVDHKSAGAIHASTLMPAGALAAFPLLGHHGGLADLPGLKTRLQDEETLARTRLARQRGLSLTGELPSATAPSVATRDQAACELFIRMLFSCLVDADYLDTECHLDPHKANARVSSSNLDDLWLAFQRNQSALQASATKTPVNVIRNEIYEECLRAAEGRQGIYRLTVPTGGGKTRSGMAFALRHAVKYGLNRVIVAIPYTSIIDQNVREYRQIFGDESVLEHTSTASQSDDDGSGRALRMQLAAENWDAPIVATTTIQLFDSLFSNKPSRCRKLHRLANSVLILDEVQTLPVSLMQPILDALKELVANYGVTLVLSTATQPAFSGDSPYLSGFDTCTEMVPEPGRYFDVLKRVDYSIRREPLSWEQVADEMRLRSQVMCVLNSRKDAVLLLNLLDDSEALHLSTLMCPAHRRDTLDEITRRLKEGEPCRVVATQVVEAGVNLDFPCVMRAIGPLDRIVQAAGRCNREGLLSLGEVIVFTPADGRTPRGNYETEMADARLLLSEPGCDLRDPSVFERYFGMVWQDCNTDAHGIRSMRSRLDFPEVANKFRMIPDMTVPVVVYYGNPSPAMLIDEITRKGFASRDDWRALAPYTTNIYLNDSRRYPQQGLIRQLLDGLFVWTGHYDLKIGLSEDLPDPSDLIVCDSARRLQI